MLAVENELMIQIPDIFTMDGIFQKLDIKGQEELVQESSHLKKIRKNLTEDIEKLNKGKELCDRWMKDNKSKPNSSAGPHGISRAYTHAVLLQTWEKTNVGRSNTSHCAREDLWAIRLQRRNLSARD